MGVLRMLVAMIRKDLLSELRTKEMFGSMLVFILIVIVMFRFAFGSLTENTALAGSGLLWIAFIFAGVLGINRSLVGESERGGLYGMMLCPMDRSLIYFGKVASNLVFLLIIEAISLPLFSVFLNFKIWPVLPGLIPVMIISSLGFVSVGTLLAGITVNTKTREILLPVLLFPVVLPIVMGAIKLTSTVFQGNIGSEFWSWTRIVVVSDIVFLLVSYLTFEFLLEE